MCEQISAGGREGGRELVREGPIRDIELLVGAKKQKIACELTMPQPN